MDDANKGGLSIEEAACLTFGYDQDILITKKIDEEFSISKMSKMAKNLADGKNLTDFEKTLKRCLPDDALKKGELQIFNAIKNLKEQLQESDMTNKSILPKQSPDKKVPIGEFLSKYLSYSSLSRNKNIASGRSKITFGKEYALLNLDKRSATLGLREISLDSIYEDESKITRINQLKNLSDSDMIMYAKKFMIKHGFDTNEVLIRQTWKHLKSFSTSTPSKKTRSFTAEDAKTQTDNVQKLKRFTASDLKKINIDKINECNDISVQNMAFSGKDIIKLDSSESDMFKKICFMYTGDMCKFMNGYLRNKLIPIYKWEEDLINAYKKLENALEFYFSTGFENKIILPYNVYNQIKRCAEKFVDHLKYYSLPIGSECWRLMGVSGFNYMIGKTIIKEDDKKLKELLADSLEKPKVYGNYNQKLSNLTVFAKNFLSTSLNSQGVLYTVGVNERSIVMKIKVKSKNEGICIDEYTPEQYRGMSEFLFNKGSKLKIESVSEYTGKTNADLLKHKCLQINCSC